MQKQKNATKMSMGVLYSAVKHRRTEPCPKHVEFHAKINL